MGNLGLSSKVRVRTLGKETIKIMILMVGINYLLDDNISSGLLSHLEDF